MIGRDRLNKESSVLVHGISPSGEMAGHSAASCWWREQVGIHISGGREAEREEPHTEARWNLQRSPFMTHSSISKSPQQPSRATSWNQALKTVACEGHVVPKLLHKGPVLAGMRVPSETVDPVAEGYI